MKMISFLLGVLIAITPEVPPTPPTAPILQNIRVLDGDTFYCDIDLGFDIVLKEQVVRIYNFDAWETSRRRQTVVVTDREIAMGKVAKLNLEQLLKGIVTVVESGHFDPYGRRSLWVFSNGKEVGAIMRAAGMERESIEPVGSKVKTKP